MWKAVSNHLRKYEQTWRGNMPFSNAVDALSIFIDAADAGIQAQANKTTGITKDKTALEEIAVENVVAIAKCAIAYTLNKKDNTLYTAMDYSSYPLLRLPQNDVSRRLRNILEAAEVEVVQLGAYGVKPNDFAEAAIVAYEAISPFARTKVANRVSAGKGFPPNQKQCEAGAGKNG